MIVGASLEDQHRRGDTGYDVAPCCSAVLAGHWSCLRAGVSCAAGGVPPCAPSSRYAARGSTRVSLGTGRGRRLGRSAHSRTSSRGWPKTLNEMLDRLEGEPGPRTTLFVSDTSLRASDPTGPTSRPRSTWRCGRSRGRAGSPAVAALESAGRGDRPTHRPPRPRTFWVIAARRSRR